MDFGRKGVQRMWEIFVVRVAYQDDKKTAVVEMWAAMKRTSQDAVDAVRSIARSGAAVGLTGALLTRK